MPIDKPSTRSRAHPAPVPHVAKPWMVRDAGARIGVRSYRTASHGQLALTWCGLQNKSLVFYKCYYSTHHPSAHESPRLSSSHHDAALLLHRLAHESHLGKSLRSFVLALLSCGLVLGMSLRLRLRLRRNRLGRGKFGDQGILEDVAAYQGVARDMPRAVDTGSRSMRVRMDG